MRLYANDDALSMLGKENMLAIMNHKYDIDWIVAWIIAEKYGALGVRDLFLIGY